MTAFRPEFSASSAPTGLEHETIVLAFGPRVLACPADITAAAGEIAREVKRRRSVIAVASPMFGERDRLLRLSQKVAPSPDPAAVAPMIVAAAAQTLALLSVALSADGVSHTILTARSARLIAQGPAYDAEPASIDTLALQRALNRAPVVLFSGAEAINERDNPVLLGGGGVGGAGGSADASDLAAVFIAESLGADVRVLSDTDGIYDRDPARARASRFRSVSWANAASNPGRPLGPRALALAARRKIVVQVAAPGGGAPSRIGDRTEPEAATAAAEIDEPVSLTPQTLTAA